MHIEGSSISCGVRRLVIDKADDASKEKLDQLLAANHSCAMIVTSIPTKRKDLKKILVESGFERMKQPAPRVPDASIKSRFDDMAFMLRNHGEEIYQDDKNEQNESNFEQYVERTISQRLIDFASSILHHGELTGNLNFFVRYMSK